MVFKVYYEVRDPDGKLHFSSVYRADCNRFAERLEKRGVPAWVGEVRKDRKKAA